MLSQQVRLDAKVSAAEERITDKTIAAGSKWVAADGSLALPSQELSHREPLRAEQQRHRLERPELREHLRRGHVPRVTLAELKTMTAQSVSRRSCVGSMRPTSTAGMWGPTASEVRFVFLPQHILRLKMAQMKKMGDPGGSFDQETARQLYLFLIAAFANLLDAKQLIIVPQGELAGLPLETLMDPQGHFLIEQ